MYWGTTSLCLGPVPKHLGLVGWGSLKSLRATNLPTLKLRPKALQAQTESKGTPCPFFWKPSGCVEGRSCNFCAWDYLASYVEVQIQVLGL